MGKFQVTLPPVGWPVQWFPQAETQRGAQAAVVLGVNGQLIILETTDTAGVKRLRTQTRHMSDPVLETNTIWRMEHGGWDWIPGLKWQDSKADELDDCFDENGFTKPGMIALGNPESSIGDSLTKARAAKAAKRAAEANVPEEMKVLG